MRVVFQPLVSSGVISNVTRVFLNLLTCLSNYALPGDNAAKGGADLC